MTNFLEQLVAEWLEYGGYFVRRNVKVGPRTKGGYDGELDIVGFHSGEKRLVHYEPSMDSDPLAETRNAFLKKVCRWQNSHPEIVWGTEVAF